MQPPQASVSMRSEGPHAEFGREAQRVEVVPFTLLRSGLFKCANFAEQLACKIGRAHV